MKKLLVYAFCLLWDLTACWPAVLLAHLVAGVPGRLRWERPPGRVGFAGLWTDLRAGTLLLRAIRRVAPLGNWGATTLGHGGVYAEGVSGGADWTETEAHENVHVEQFEGICLIMLAVAATFYLSGGPLLPAAVTWWAAWPLYVGANSLVAVLRGEDAYRGSVHEEGARGHGA